MNAVAKINTPFRVGQWLPSDHEILNNWLEELIQELSLKGEQSLHPVIQKFKDFIENDAEVYMLFSLMFTQVNHKKDPSGNPQVKSYLQMLQLLNAIMTRAPKYARNGLVGFPINAILDWSMGTPSGYAAFLNDKVNFHLKAVLNEWARYLGSKDSTFVLNKDPKTGWFGADAMEDMPDFVDDFICNPELPHYGFTSWDDFFTRQFRDGRRPVAYPDDPAVIVNACESAPYKIARKIEKSDTFWIKSQPYSLQHMLANDSFVDTFVDGTIYQAFLSALSYHRWHSPVSGIVESAYVIDGTYYSESWEERFDPAGPNDSQGYITELATRALIFIKADNPDIGLMCFMAVGMAEVSTCEITVYEGQHIKKGDELGMFHFGGSTHCLIFRPEVNLEFDLHGQTPGLKAKNIEAKERIATVTK